MSERRPPRDKPRYTRLSSAASQESRDSPYSRRSTPDPYEGSPGDTSRADTSRADTSRRSSASRVSTSSAGRSTPARNGAKNEGFVADDRKEQYRDRRDSYRDRKDSYRERLDSYLDGDHLDLPDRYSDRNNESYAPSDNENRRGSNRKDSYPDRRDSNPGRADSYTERRNSNTGAKDSFKSVPDVLEVSPEISPKVQQSSRQRRISVRDNRDNRQAPTSPDPRQPAPRPPTAASPPDTEEVFHDSHSPPPTPAKTSSPGRENQAGHTDQSPFMSVTVTDGRTDENPGEINPELLESIGIYSGRHNVSSLTSASTHSQGHSEAKATKMDQWRGLFYCLNSRCMSWLTVFLVFTSWLPLLFMVEVGEARYNVTRDAKLMLGPSHRSWLYPVTDSHLDVYFFNVTNAGDYTQDGEAGFVPLVQEVGPYSYRMTLARRRVTWLPHNHSVTYATVPTFTFDPWGSRGHGVDDVIVTANVPRIIIQKQLKEEFFGSLLSFDDKTPMFESHSVKELLWGYSAGSFTEFAAALQKINYFGLLNSTIEKIPKQFGFLKGKNGTVSDMLNVFTGKGDFSKFNLVHSYNYKTKLDFWKTDAANTIEGSDGSIFKPLMDKNTPISFFSEDMYRSFKLQYSRPTRSKGVNCLRYIIPDSQLANTSMADPVVSRDRQDVNELLISDIKNRQPGNIDVSESNTFLGKNHYNYELTRKRDGASEIRKHDSSRASSKRTNLSRIQMDGLKSVTESQSQEDQSLTKTQPRIKSHAKRTPLKTNFVQTRASENNNTLSSVNSTQIKNEDRIATTSLGHHNMHFSKVKSENLLYQNPYASEIEPSISIRDHLSSNTNNSSHDNENLFESYFTNSFDDFDDEDEDDSYYYDDIEVNGLSSLLGSSAWDDDDVADGNGEGGFCVPTCLPDGVYGLHTVLKQTAGVAAPLYVSLPHLLGADPVYLAGVGGLTPDEHRHRPYFDIEAVTGVAVSQHRRYQLNVQLPSPSSPSPPPVSLLPLLWVDTSMALNDDDAYRIRSAHNGYMGVDATGWVLTVLCGFLWVVLGTLCAVNRCRNYKNQDVIPDPNEGRPWRWSYT